MSQRTVTIPQDDWQAAARERYGANWMDWRFVCPSCGHAAASRDWKAAGLPETMVAFSCVGRGLPNPKEIFGRPGPCNYAGGGLFGLNPVGVVLPDGETSWHFDFADRPLTSTQSKAEPSAEERR